MNGTVLVRAVVVLGVLFRLAGAVANTEANDDHMEVIRVMASERRMPAPDEFWEAFQPPLYHVTVAAALTALPELPADAEVKVAQAVSCVAGLATLFILMAFIGRLSHSPGAAGMAIALTSLNPALISTSIQATNDAFVILFATLALSGGYRFFQTGRVPAFVAMTSGVLLACLSKGNGLVMAIAVLLTLAAAVGRPTMPRLRIAGFAVSFVVVLAAIVPAAGGYLRRHAVMGSAFAINQEPVSAPDLLRESFHKRPGITSVAGGFLTFRLVSMLEDPLLEVPFPRTSGADYPRHRTSLWSLLYGGVNSTQYAYYPETWRAPRAVAEWLVRFAVVFALLPTIVLAVGVGRGAMQCAAALFSKAEPHGLHPNLLLALSALGYLAFVALYGYRYRDFATMKAIFVIPAALAGLVAFVREVDRPGGRARRLFTQGAFASSVLLCLTYAADIGVLVARLIEQMLGPA